MDLVGRILAIDYGTKRIGLALSDELGVTARPLEVYARRGRVPDMAHLAARVAEHEVRRVVVGVPNRLDGSEGDAAKRALVFIEQVRAALAPTPVTVRDEALTTWAAEERMKEEGLGPDARKKHVDAYAALVLLEEELEALRAERD